MVFSVRCQFQRFGVIAILFAWFAASLSPECAVAQTAASDRAPLVKIVIPATKPVLDEIEFIIKLAPTKALREEAATVRDTIEGFADGLDKNKPLRFDLLLGGEEYVQRLHLPVSKLSGNEGFLSNLQGLGYKEKKVANDANLYTLTQQPAAPAPGKPAPPPTKPIYLRFRPVTGGSATGAGLGSIAPTAELIPANAPDPFAELAELLSRKFSVAIDVRNPAEGIEQRRTEIKRLRKGAEDAVKFKRDESKEQFELRKLLGKRMWEEVERFAVEADHLLVTFLTNTTDKLGQGEFELTALPNTDLQKSLEEFGTRVSRFANVELHAEPTVSGKICVPLDSVRKQHLDLLMPALTPVLNIRIDQWSKLTPAGKEAAKKEFDLLTQLVTKSTAELGVFDAFIDGHLVDKKTVLVCGVQVADSAPMVSMIEQLPVVRDEWKTKTKIENYGGFDLHTIEVAEKRREEFQTIFAGDPVLYCATGPNLILGATGANSLAELKGVIDALNKPLPTTADPVFLTFDARMGPGSNLFDLVRRKEKTAPAPGDKPKTKAELQLEKQMERLSKYAIECFSSADDSVSIRMQRKGPQITGSLTIHEGIYKFLGAIVADFSLENLH